MSCIDTLHTLVFITLIGIGHLAFADDSFSPCECPKELLEAEKDWRFASIELVRLPIRDGQIMQEPEVSHLLFLDGKYRLHRSGMSLQPASTNDSASHASSRDLLLQWDGEKQISIVPNEKVVIDDRLIPPGEMTSPIQIMLHEVNFPGTLLQLLQTKA